MKVSQQKYDITSISTLLLIHFSICSIGLLGFISHVASWIGGAFFQSFNIFIVYSDWATLSTTSTKPIELVQYALSVSAMLFYYVIVLAFIKTSSCLADKTLKRFAPTRVVIIIYLGLLFLLNIWLLKDHGEFSNIFFGFWFLILVLPALPLVNSWLDRISNGGGLWTTAICVSLVASLAFIFYPYITGGLAVSNDYMDIPEQTILSTGIVDNTDYINAHRIGGLHKHDPRLGLGEIQLPREGEFIKLNKSEALSKFAKYAPRKFMYEDRSAVLVVKELMEPNEVDILSKIAANEAERGRIYGFYYNQMERAKFKKSYSQEEKEFIRKNKRELSDQSLAGHYFHHQNTMLGTINEYVLGKPQSQTVYLYGWLSTVAIAEGMKALGGITFESYQKVFYSFYPFYYLLLIAAAAIIFKKIEYILLVGVISISSLYLLGFEYIRFAPGFNPIRHFFDIFALVCFSWYLFSPRRNWIYLALALVFSIVGILFSKEFGLVLLLSMLATIIVRVVVDHRKATSEIILMVIAILAALAAVLMITTGKNPTLIYVLMGVASPGMHWIKMFSLLLLFSAIYVLLIKSRKAGDNWLYLSLFWFLYAQGLLIYYVWNPVPNHLMSLGSVLGMLFALLLRNLSINYDWAVKYEKKILLVSNSLLVMVMFLPGVSSYCLDQRDYQRVFAEHKLHRWDFSRAQFISTMDPNVFENSVQLINKYSSRSSIYLLSKYDNILPFLSAKYNAMPFTEMALSLVTKKEMDMSIGQIRHDRPEYLFVDTDMERNHLWDIYEYDKNSPINLFFLPNDLVDATRGRAMVLDNFAKVFEEIKDMYYPVETGQLITVYKLRGAPA